MTSTDEIQVWLPEKGRVSDVFTYLLDCYPDLQLSGNDILVTVNKKVSDVNQRLNPDDKVAFLPHIGGG